MDYEHEIQNIISAKVGNKEIAIFIEDGEYSMELGNSSQHVRLGEISGDLSVTGSSLKEVINLMKLEVGI